MLLYQIRAEMLGAGDNSKKLLETAGFGSKTGAGCQKVVRNEHYLCLVLPLFPVSLSLCILNALLV